MASCCTILLCCSNATLACDCLPKPPWTSSGSPLPPCTAKLTDSRKASAVMKLGRICLMTTREGSADSHQSNRLLRMRMSIGSQNMAPLRAAWQAKCSPKWRLYESLSFAQAAKLCHEMQCPLQFATRALFSRQNCYRSGFAGEQHRCNPFSWPHDQPVMCAEHIKL